MKNKPFQSLNDELMVHVHVQAKLTSRFEFTLAILKIHFLLRPQKKCLYQVKQRMIKNVDR